MEKTTKLTLTEKPSAPSFIHRGNSVGKKNEEDTKKTVKRKRKKAAFRKAPEAPRRFKSPYILFSISKMAEYKSSTPNVQVTAISRRIAEEWKTLSDSEKRKWDQVALQDKLRYNAEKRLYTGPWQVPSKRSRKVRTNVCALMELYAASKFESLALLASRILAHPSAHHLRSYFTAKPRGRN